MQSCDFGVVRKDAVDVIAVNLTEHKRAARTRFLWIEKVLDGPLLMPVYLLACF